MINEANSDHPLPTCVGSQDTEDIFEVRRELDALRGQAMGMARAIVTQTKDLDALWDKLLPILDEVEAILSKHCSRRQRRRAPGLPTWEEWRHAFLREANLDVSDRTAQRRLKAFREPKLPGTHASASRLRGATPLERYQGLLAQQAANDLFNALTDGDDLEDACAKFLAMRMDPDRLRQIIWDCPKPREASGIGVGHANPSAVLTLGAVPFHLGRPGVFRECEIDFKPGNWSLLAEFITVEHRQHFEAVFAALSSFERRRVFQEFVAAIEKNVVHLGGNGNDMKLAPAKWANVECEPSPAA